MNIYLKSIHYMYVYINTFLDVTSVKYSIGKATYAILLLI